MQKALVLTGKCADSDFPTRPVMYTPDSTCLVSSLMVLSLVGLPCCEKICSYSTQYYYLVCAVFALYVVCIMYMDKSISVSARTIPVDVLIAQWVAVCTCSSGMQRVQLIARHAQDKPQVQTTLVSNTQHCTQHRQLRPLLLGTERSRAEPGSDELPKCFRYPTAALTANSPLSA